MRHVTELYKYTQNQYTVWNLIMCLNAQLRGQITSLNFIVFSEIINIAKQGV